MGETLRERLLSNKLVVEIPGLPPSVNHTYSFTRRGAFKKPEVRKWEGVAHYLISQASQEAYGKQDLSIMRGEPIRLILSFIRPSWRAKSGLNKGRLVRPDVSNFIKVTEDAVCGALGLDDSAVVELTVLKLERSGDIRTEIVLEFVNERGN